MNILFDVEPRIFELSVVRSSYVIPVRRSIFQLPQGIVLSNGINQILTEFLTILREEILSNLL